MGLPTVSSVGHCGPAAYPHFGLGVGCMAFQKSGKEWVGKGQVGQRTGIPVDLCRLSSAPSTSTVLSDASTLDAVPQLLSGHSILEKNNS